MDQLAGYEDEWKRITLYGGSLTLSSADLFYLLIYVQLAKQLNPNNRFTWLVESKPVKQKVTPKVILLLSK